MATSQSTFNRFQTSSPVRIQSGTQVTTAAAQRLAPIPIRSFPSRGATVKAISKEPEDALLTGGTRSLDRRLLGLNVLGSLPAREIAGFKAVPERMIAARQPAVA